MAHQPYVPEKTNMKEFTMRALIIGLVMTVVLGAANAYLGLRAGMTIAATYPAAVIGMAVLKLMRGSILEENIARTVGSIGESVAAGAIFTIPAFVLVAIQTNSPLLADWKAFKGVSVYLKSSLLMFVGGLLGILFVTFLRRVMVTDPDLPYPESTAAAEIHKAGQRGSASAKFLFQAMGLGSLIYALGVLKIFSATKNFFIKVGTLGQSLIKLGTSNTAPTLSAGGQYYFSGPGILPAYIGVGYIIGPRLAALNFAGGVLAWGLFAPLLIFFVGPQLASTGLPLFDPDGVDYVTNVWLFIIRPIAVGGMLMGAGYTLYRMRKNLAAGMKRSIGDVKKAAGQTETVGRLEKDLNFRIVFAGLAAAFILMIFVYKIFSGSMSSALIAAVVMIIAGFFFAAVSGNLVGQIGSSNNPISGLTLSTLIIAALLMVLIGVTGINGVIAVLGVAAVVCVSSAVAGEMLQDLKVGHLLGGTPWKMQVGNMFGILVASLALFFPLMILHGAFKFGSPELSAPQAGLMAALSQGIVGGQMAWPLVIVGMLMGLAMILVQIRSPMLVAVGMYLPLSTTFAIFCGGMIKGIVDKLVVRRKLNDGQKARVENVGILLAAGLIAGEALTGLVHASLRFFEVTIPALFVYPAFRLSLKIKSFIDLKINFSSSTNAYLVGLFVLFLMGFYLVAIPLRKAGRPDEPPPPSAII